MRINNRPYRRSADPPKNQLGTTGAVSPLSWHARVRSFSSRNGTSITAQTFSNCELVIFQRWTLYTRSLCSSATRMLSMSWIEQSYSRMWRGKGGQMANVFFQDVLAE